MSEKQEKKTIMVEKKSCVCVLCGERLPSGARYYRMHGFPYCEDCLLFSSVETVIRICEKPTREWFENQGFQAIQIV